MGERQTSEWTRCYDDSWRGEITFESWLDNKRQDKPVLLLSFHVATVAHGHKICWHRSIRLPLEKTGRRFMMHIQVPTKNLLGDLAISTVGILFAANYPAYHFPTRTVFSPTALPRWMILATPIRRLPCPKALSVTKVLFLSSSPANLPWCKRNTQAAKGTRFFNDESILPASSARERTTAMVVTEVPRQNSIGLKFNLFSTCSTSNLYSATLACGISSGKELAATRHRTKSSNSRFLSSQIGLEVNNSIATRTLSFNPRQAFHAT